MKKIFKTKNIKAVLGAGGDLDYFNSEQSEKIIAGNSKSAYMTYTEKSHSAIIKYELFQTSDIKWYSKLSD